MENDFDEKTFIELSDKIIGINKNDLKEFLAILKRNNIEYDFELPFNQFDDKNTFEQSS